MGRLHHESFTRESFATRAEQIGRVLHRHLDGVCLVLGWNARDRLRVAFVLLTPVVKSCCRRFRERRFLGVMRGMKLSFFKLWSKNLALQVKCLVLLGPRFCKRNSNM